MKGNQTLPGAVRALPSAAASPHAPDRGMVDEEANDFNE